MFTWHVIRKNRIWAIMLKRYHIFNYRSISFWERHEICCFFILLIWLVIFSIIARLLFLAKISIKAYQKLRYNVRILFSIWLPRTDLSLQWHWAMFLLKKPFWERCFLFFEFYLRNYAQEANPSTNTGCLLCNHSGFW